MKTAFLLLASALLTAAGPAFDIVDVVLPPHETTADEEYLCTSAPLPGDGASPLKLTGVAPLASKETVHHMLLFGECERRGVSPSVVRWQAVRATAQSRVDCVFWSGGAAGVQLQPRAPGVDVCVCDLHVSARVALAGGRVCGRG